MAHVYLAWRRSFRVGKQRVLVGDQVIYTVDLRVDERDVHVPAYDQAQETFV